MARTGAMPQYWFPLENFISREKFQRLKDFAAGRETPCLILDLDVVRSKYEELRANFPFAKVYFSVKANPRDELDQLLRLGVSPDRMSFGNTVK